MSYLTRLAVVAGLLIAGGPAVAQQNPGFFMPPSANPAPSGPRPAAPPPASPGPRAATPAPRPAPTVQVAPPPAGGNGQDAPVQVQLPPVPDLPPLARGPAPPGAIIGVLGIPDIMRASSAAQQVEKLIGERREKLNEDAQREQEAWRGLQQALANQRATLNADQIRTRERELQERITNSQRVFRDRNRFIQEAAQVGLAQIERMLIATIRQVAESRGMNLVLHRAQVALNINEFDITEPVVEQMNKTLPTVILPPDGVSAVAAQEPQAAVPPVVTPPTPPPAAPAAPPAATPPASRR